MCYIWIAALYGAVIWTLRKVHQKYLEGLKFGVGESWRKSVGPIVWEIGVLQKFAEEKILLYKSQQNAVYFIWQLLYM
jgi:hypothetical protein